VRQVLLADPDVANAGENRDIPFSASPSDPLFAVAASPPQYQWAPDLPAPRSARDLVGEPYQSEAADDRRHSRRTRRIGGAGSEGRRPRTASQRKALRTGGYRGRSRGSRFMRPFGTAILDSGEWQGNGGTDAAAGVCGDAVPGAALSVRETPGEGTAATPRLCRSLERGTEGGVPGRQNGDLPWSLRRAGRRGSQAVHAGVRPRAANLGDVPPCGWRSCLSSYLAAFSSVARDARATFASCTAFGS
jgi:hypothetical protein